MPQVMVVVRGNLGGNPDFLPAKVSDDGTGLPASLRMTVYEDRRRIPAADGEWSDDPRGPIRVTVRMSGRAAELVHRIDLRQGDPVVAVGRLDDPDAFVTRDGAAAARLVVRASVVTLDSMRLRQREEHLAATDTTDAGDAFADPFAAESGEGC